MASTKIAAGDLTAMVGDNAEDAALGHRAGYNGLWSLVSDHERTTLFVPTVAGLNLEHVVDGQAAMNEREQFFEPRHAPMELRDATAASATLHQPATPRTGLESWTRFAVREPHYVDLEFRCVPRKPAAPFGYLACFWASYINGPEDKSIYFRAPAGAGAERWQQFCTQWHNRDATALHVEDRFEMKFEPGFRDCLFNDRALSQARFAQPFYYGRFRDMLWLIMFESASGLRFTHSPSGGGATPDKQDTNPAWDFQFVMPQAEVGREYRLRARAVYKPWRGRADVLAEWKRFRQP